MRKDIDKYQTQIINDENRKQSYGVFSKCAEISCHMDTFWKESKRSRIQKVNFESSDVPRNRRHFYKLWKITLQNDLEINSYILSFQVIKNQSQNRDIGDDSPLLVTFSATMNESFKTVYWMSDIQVSLRKYNSVNQNHMSILFYIENEVLL